MTEKKYNIVLTGEIQVGADKTKAMDAFAKIFKISPEKTKAIFGSAPRVIKKEQDELTAKKYAAAFKRVGIGFKITQVAQVPQGAQAPDNQEEKVIHEESTAPSAHDSSVENPTVANPIVQPEKYLGYTFDIAGQPDYAYLNVEIPANQTLKVEASGMATMDTHIKMKTRMKGGLGRFLTGENIFINEFTAENAAGNIGIAPATPGDLCHQYLDGDTIYLQNSAFVAATNGISVESKWQGMLKGFFSGEKLFLIRCQGNGDLWFNTYGAMIEIDVNDNYVVDTGNIVAFTEGLEYNISKVGGYKSLFFSGEGFVCRFSGKGKVWIQTRSAASFAAWAQYFRPTK